MRIGLLYLYIFIVIITSTINYKIRFGRERSRILKLKKRKGVFTRRLELLTKTRGVGLFPCFATDQDSIYVEPSDIEYEDEDEDDIEEAEDQEEEIEVENNIQDEEKLEELESIKSPDLHQLQKKKRGPKNPIIEHKIDHFDPLFQKIPALRTPKRIITSDSRPGSLDPDSYAKDYAEVDDWDIHPSKIRVRGKYFSKLYQHELREPLKRHMNDTGSPEVVIASLTAKIDYLSYHVNNNRKDVQAKRQIIKLAYQRRRLLYYLFRTKKDLFDKLTETFNLKFEDTPFNDDRILKNMFIYYEEILNDIVQLKKLKKEN